MNKDINDSTKNLLKTQINSIIPHQAKISPPQPDIPENILNFMHIYNNPAQQQSQTITDTPTEPTTIIENLKILSRNIGGGLQKKLNPTNQFMQDIILYQPHIILIQEHMIYNTSLTTFRRTMRIRGYKLATYAKGTMTKGRPSGGLAIWIKTSLLNTHTYTINKNTSYIQNISIKHKTSTDDHPLHITNTYCRPEISKKRIQRHYNTLHDIHKTLLGRHIIIGDLNSKTETIGDKKTNTAGRILQQFTTQHNWHILNKTLAYGQPTYKSYIKKGYSIVDIAITPQIQQHNWKSMHIIQPQTIANKNGTHLTTVITSNYTIESTYTPAEYQYKINYNATDKHRLTPWIHNQIKKPHDNITEHINDTLRKTTDTAKKHSIIVLTQYILFAIQHITALTIFGIKKIRMNKKNDHTLWQDDEEINKLIQQIENEPTIKSNLTNYIQEKYRQDKLHKKHKQHYEKPMEMYKKYSKNKQIDKTPCPEHIKINNELYPIEVGYSKYLSEYLMKQHNHTPPQITNNYQHEEVEIIKIDTIRQVMNDMNKDKSPGMTGIPIKYYHWGGETMQHLLLTWYKIMQEHNIIPWNLKIDIKIPFPKFEEGAFDITQHDPANYRPIALQNSMYKILDGTIKIALENHNKKHNIIEINQGGFQKKQGTLEHLFVIQNLFHHNPSIYLAFLDFEKAYDSVKRKHLTHKLHHKYSVPIAITNMIDAMYDNTFSTTRVGNKLSIRYQTYQGLQQGALSSPILFNYFINDLITELNETQIGAKIGDTIINNLLFADDVVLAATSETELQHLLDVCTQWGAKWKLKFSPHKSKTLTNQSKGVRTLKLAHKDIKETNTKNYKYLGIPITGSGINVRKYFNHIINKLKSSLKEMIVYCQDNQISTYNRLLLYKTIVRSQLDYGIPVINYTNNEKKRLEREQINSLRILLQLDSKTNEHTLLAITDVPTIKHRIDTMKMSFYLKLKQGHTQSLAQKIVQQHIQQPTIVKTHKTRIAPIAEFLSIFRKYKHQGLYDLDLQIPHKEIEHIIKTNLRTIRNNNIISHLHDQCTKIISDEYRPFTTTNHTPGGAIAKTLKTYNKIQIDYDNTYLPSYPHNHRYELYECLTHCDHNPKWQDYHNCPHCNIQHQYPYMHQLLTCNYQHERQHIFQSIINELIYYSEKYAPNTTIIANEAYQVILDAAESGTIEPQDYDITMETFFGNHLNQSMEVIATNHIKRMLISHLLLLINITQNKIKPIQSITYLTEYNKQIATEDMQQGKLIVRMQQKDGTIYYENIRHLIESMTLPELEHYNIGLGAANNRTTKQKKLAQKYTNITIAKAHNTIIVVDGSINTKDNPMTEEEQKRTQKGYGGCGGIIINKYTNDTIHTFTKKVDTNDPQLAELHGIYTALQKSLQMHKTHFITKFTILCDCKNAVKYINNKYAPPRKYSTIYQKIQELKRQIKQSYEINIKWIPGHTDNKWNDRADSLAKKATLLHLPGNRSHLGRASGSDPP